MPKKDVPGISVNYAKGFTGVDASFVFKGDVPEHGYTLIWDRMKVQKNRVTQLDNYLFLVEGFEYDINEHKYFDLTEKGREIAVRPNSREMKLEISVRTKNPVEKKEDLFNVDNFYVYILTGVYPKG